MRKTNINELRIAKPCPASWADMSGDDRVRHCSLCQQNVYDLSTMTRKEVEHVIQAREGRVCVRMYRRDDGKVMTADCPRGLAIARRRAASLVLACASLVFASGFAVARAIGSRDAGRTFNLNEVQPFKMLSEWAQPSAPKLAPKPMPTPMMGDIAMPSSSWSKGGPSKP
jgi:hypothetical protein